MYKPLPVYCSVLKFNKNVVCALSIFSTQYYVSNIVSKFIEVNQCEYS